MFGNNLVRSRDAAEGQGTRSDFAPRTPRFRRGLATLDLAAYLKYILR